MKQSTIVMTDSMREELLQAASQDVEMAAVVLARPVIHDNSIRLLANRVCWVPREQYTRQDAYGLTIRSEGYVHALSAAETMGCVPIWFHTHPGEGANPTPSSHDHVVDREIADLFRLRSGSPLYVTLIGAVHRGNFVFTGTVQPEGQAQMTLDRVWSVGDRFRLAWQFGEAQSVTSPEFDRSVRAFGPVIQRTLADLRIAIVGCGGTGSAVGEQLIRLGARQLVLVDPDTLSASNVTRVYGSHPGAIGQSKVGVLAAHLKTIAPEATVATVANRITNRGVAEQLLDRDLVFGCTDDNAGRLVLSRLATYFLTPVIDCGVLLSHGANETLSDIILRVTTLVPGQGCLVCRNRIDVARAAAELLDPDEQEQRVREGYAPALGAVEPAVVTFTTTVAALAVSELLERLIGYGPEPRPSEVLYRAHDRETSTNLCAARERHYCHPSSAKIGLGITEPLLEQTWPDSR